MGFAALLVGLAACGVLSGVAGGAALSDLAMEASIGKRGGELQPYRVDAGGVSLVSRFDRSSVEISKSLC